VSRSSIRSTARSSRRPPGRAAFSSAIADSPTRAPCLRPRQARHLHGWLRPLRDA
jgi:hypothetical protein